MGRSSAIRRGARILDSTSTYILGPLPWEKSPARIRIIVSSSTPGVNSMTVHWYDTSANTRVMHASARRNSLLGLEAFRGPAIHHDVYNRFAHSSHRRVDPLYSARKVQVWKDWSGPYLLIESFRPYPHAQVLYAPMQPYVLDFVLEDWRMKHLIPFCCRPSVANVA